MKNPRILTRREWLGVSLAALPAWSAATPGGPVIDTHIHMFAADQKRFPFHPNAPYRPQPQPLEPYVEFVRQTRIDHVVLVQPEPYQDDHRYVEYCFAHEPTPGFFKGTFLFDPILPGTPARMEALASKYPGRFVALRIHEVRAAGLAPSAGGPIKERDLEHPGVKATLRKLGELNMAVQFQLVPCHAPAIGKLIAGFPGLPVILDHFGRPGQGTKAEYAEVLKLARHPRAVMKFSGVEYFSKQKPPHRDAAPIVRQAFDAFGPDRMIWGGLGHSMEEFKRATETFETLLGFASEADRAKIRGLTAIKLCHLQKE